MASTKKSYTLSMLADVRELLKQGNHFAADKQWEQAGQKFSFALDDLYGMFMPDVENMFYGDGPAVYDKLEKEARDAKEKETHDPTSTPANEDLVLRFEGGEVGELKDDLSEIHGFERLKDVTDGFDHAAAFRYQCFYQKQVTPPIWTIAFYRYEDEHKKYGGLPVQVIADSCVLILTRLTCYWLKLPVTWSGDDPSVDEQLCGLLSRMAYAWAHRAEATTQQTKGLYTLNQILLAESIPALYIRMEDYFRSLLLDPTRAWTLAHYADVFRDMANSVRGTAHAYGPSGAAPSGAAPSGAGGWTDPTTGHMKPDLGRDHGLDENARLVCYVNAIVYLRAAVDRSKSHEDEQSPAYSRDNHAWALAHLGAAVVNARGFVAWEDDFDDGGMMAGLLKDWPVRWLDEHGVDDSLMCGKKNLCFMNRALRCLTKAQALQGFFYPWCQVYMAASMLLKGIFLAPDAAIKRTSEPAVVASANLSSLSFLQVSLAYYLQPSLLGSVMEPGQLSINPMFEIAAVMSFVKNQEMAWQYAWIGMRWLFKFNFQPGLFGLTGYGLLAGIASCHLDSLNRTPRPMASNLIVDAALEDAPDTEGLHVPIELIATSDDLYKLINQACDACLKPHLGFWLRKDVKLDSNAVIGLVTTIYVLRSFSRIIRRHPDGLPSLRDYVSAKVHTYCEDIQQRLGAQPIEDDGDDDEVARKHEDALFAFVDGAHQNYYTYRFKSLQDTARSAPEGGS